MASESPQLTVEVEQTGPCSKLLKITVPSERVDREIESTFKNVSQAVQFPGFRRGKAPRKLVEARLGDRVLEEVKERLVQSAVDEAIDEQELKTIGHPRLEYDKIELAKGADLAFEIGLDVRPEFDLPTLEELEVARPTSEVSEEDVDEEIERQRMDRADVLDAGDEPLEELGILRMGVTLKVGDDLIVDDEEIEWQHPSTLLGGMTVDGLLDALTGAKKGDDVELTTTLPEDFRDERHRGAEAQIQLSVRGVEHVRPPEANDEFAQNMDYDDLAEMREELKKQLARRKQAEAERALDDAIVDALIIAVPFDVPPSLVAAESGRMLRQYEMQLRQQGLDEQMVVQQVLAAKEQAETRVTRDLRAGFILDKIATEKKVFVTENEVLQEIASMAAQYNRTPTEMHGYIERNNLEAPLRSTLRERKTLRELREIVQIRDGEATADAAEGESEA